MVWAIRMLMAPYPYAGLEAWLHCRCYLGTAHIRFHVTFSLQW